MYHYYKSFGWYGELARSVQHVQSDSGAGDVAFTAWQVAGTWLLTGETTGERVRPARPFDPDNGQWGAVQIVARYGTLRAGDAAFDEGFADPSSSQAARALTLGATWYLNALVKGMFNYDWTTFDDNDNAATSRDPEHTLAFRLQLSF